MNTFDYIDYPGIGPGNAPQVRNLWPIRFNVHAVAHAIEQVETGVVSLAQTNEASQAFETIMAQYQAMEKELSKLRVYEREADILFNRGKNLNKPAI